MSIRSIIGQHENAAGARFGLAFCLLGRAEAILLARGAGFDFAVIDMEHGPLGLGDLGQAAAVGLAAGLPVYGRVTGPASPDIARVLDCGATGVIVPHVDSAEEAANIARACHFAPRGARALPGPLPALDYRVVPAAELTDTAERQVEVIAMIESAAALEAVEDIAATPGIDMLMIGSNDLADGIGHRGDLAHPEVLAAFARIAGAARTNGRGFGVMGLPPALVRSHALSLGATTLVASNETNLIAEGGAALLRALRETLSPEADADSLP
ncbi:HpcH/HpaI aldolase family protein [Salipiger mangrovisoli]|uniref:Aldolase n=1 Tax=Salipiger mangrovisoli TaxID=2865933 RepID=A0ABR9X023_9RHOB|nr:aldolase/citrate lyase family protein [Salipiger mangrovisoli]MBE9636836.1 aldolase [Salipiger mangrovisoli]